MPMLKPLIRDAIYRAGWIAGHSNPQRSSVNRLTVITFHRILTSSQREQYMHPGLAVTPQELDWICEQITPRYQCGTLSDTFSKWVNNEKTDKPYLAITFDDGQKDNFVNARSVLAKHKIKATFYIPVQNINQQQLIWHDQLGFALQAAMADHTNKAKLFELAGRYHMRSIDHLDPVKSITEQAKSLSPENRCLFVADVSNLSQIIIPEWAQMMSWEQIKQLSDEGHEIGSHSMTHELIPQLTDDKLHWEISESKKEIEAKLGSSIRSFCYPNGDNDIRCRQATEETGYKNAVTTQPGVNRMSTDRYSLSRCDINTQYLTDRKNNLSSDRLFFRLTRSQNGLG
jgi:peptidoglycan/xylan/chitin deacetylase (PgdA/CDA1 family)